LWVRNDECSIDVSPRERCADIFWWNSDKLSIAFRHTIGGKQSQRDCAAATARFSD
jgi:hypothetical protein